MAILQLGFIMITKAEIVSVQKLTNRRSLLCLWAPTWAGPQCLSYMRSRIFTCHSPKIVCWMDTHFLVLLSWEQDSSYCIKSVGMGDSGMVNPYLILYAFGRNEKSEHFCTFFKDFPGGWQFFIKLEWRHSSRGCSSTRGICQKGTSRYHRIPVFTGCLGIRLNTNTSYPLIPSFSIKIE